MAFIKCEWRSEVLRKNCSMNVIMPQKPQIEPERGSRLYPVVYLLHGLSDDHTTWSRRTSIERYAKEYDAIIVMPNVDRSFYTDMVAGYNYWTMISEELPEVIQNMFPASPKREDTFVVGLSMGGYGALKLALRRPDRYAAGVSLSGCTDVRTFMGTCAEYLQVEFARIFGTVDDLIPNGNDLFDLAEKAIQAPNCPRILTVCGTEDFLYKLNLRFRDHMRKIKFPNYEFLEGPGTHEWGFWDYHIQYSLKFLLNNR